MSVRQNALAEIVSRLEGISTVGGYATDAGQVVYIGERPTLTPDDPTAVIAVLVREDAPGFQGEHAVISLPVEVLAIVRKDVAASAWLSVEAVVGDIKTAVEQDHDLGGVLLPRGLERGSTRPLDREEGSEYVGASVEYRLRFKELWGQP